MTYNVKCQVDGWPEGVLEEEKVLLAKTARAFVEAHGPQSLYVIERHLAYQLFEKGLWKSRSILWDHVYATVERACSAELEPVWQIRERG